MPLKYWVATLISVFLIVLGINDKDTRWLCFFLAAGPTVLVADRVLK